METTVRIQETRKEACAPRRAMQRIYHLHSYKNKGNSANIWF